MRGRHTQQTGKSHAETSTLLLSHGRASAPGTRPLEHSNQAVQHLLRTREIQAKLSISAPGDESEREADEVADRVMRMPDSGSVQRMCDECEEEAQAVIQTKPANSAAVPAALGSGDLGGLRGGGQPLPMAARSFFENRMAHDFAGVRVHADARADELSRSVSARAFTHGNHIVFRTGEYSPDTSSGRRLLAHELTHTIQQGASPASSLTAGTSLGMTEGAHSQVASVQRACEFVDPPADMVDCDPATSTVGSGTSIQFGLDVSDVTPSRATISAIAAAWHAGGRTAVLRIDGFASCDGAPDHNWRLSCSRALAVKAELEAPSDKSPGVLSNNIEVFANGETDQFSTTSLAANRRAVISSGGAPPPGPACGLTVTGPDEVDHYCAAYVPSDAAACGTFPAPTIVLTVAGAAASATTTWSIVRGAANASIVGTNTAASVVIQGDAASAAQGDVIVQVTDGTCTTQHFVTVREPSEMTATEAPTATPTTISDVITYTVRDQFGNPMGAGICVDETVTQCANSHAIRFAFGDAATSAAGRIIDNLSLTWTNGPIPSSLCVKLDQTWTAGGCGPLLHNTILFRQAGITLTRNGSCAAGDPCP
jgi:outer membrane protein OmpA-like peptidoglycan-associated protein